jgi:hypothetical protein
MPDVDNYKKISSSDLLQLAIRDFYDNRLENALSKLRALIDRDEKVENLELLRAVCLSYTGFDLVAIEAIERELDFFPHNQKARQFHKELKETLLNKINLTDSLDNYPTICYLACNAPGETPDSYLRSLRSLLMQKYPKFKIIFAPDRAAPFLESLSHNEANLVVLPPSPTNRASRLNNAIKSSAVNDNDVYGLLLSSETLFTRTGLTAAAEVFKGCPNIDFLTTERCYIDRYGLICQMRAASQRWGRKLFFDRLNFLPPTFHLSPTYTLFRKKLLTKLESYFDESLSQAFDFELFARFFRTTTPVTVKTPLAATKIEIIADTEKLGIKYIGEALSVIKREEEIEVRDKDKNSYLSENSATGNRIELYSASTTYTMPITTFSFPTLSDQEKLWLAEHGPTITLVTPVLNQKKFIEEQLHSIIRQNYPKLEFLMLDAGSNDGTLDILDKYKKHFSFFRSARDFGQYYALQEGFNRSRGEVMTWLNGDDSYTQDALWYAALIFTKRRDVRWVSGLHSTITETAIRTYDCKNYEYSHKNFISDGFDKPFIQQEGTFWRRDLWDEAGGSLDLRWSLAGDCELWSRFYRYAKLYTCDIPLAFFRMHEEQRSARFLPYYYREAYEISMREKLSLEEMRIVPSEELSETIKVGELLRV